MNQDFSNSLLDGINNGIRTLSEMHIIQQRQVQDSLAMGENIMKMLAFLQEMGNHVVTLMNSQGAGSSLGGGQETGSTPPTTNENMPGGNGNVSFQEERGLAPSNSNQNITDENENNCGEEATCQGMKRSVGDGSKESEKKRSRTVLLEPNTAEEPTSPSCIPRESNCPNNSQRFPECAKVDVKSIITKFEHDIYIDIHPTKGEEDPSYRVFEGGEGLYSCNHCEKKGMPQHITLMTENDLTDHHARYHLNRRYLCRKCPNVYCNLQDLKNQNCVASENPTEQAEGRAKSVESCISDVAADNVLTEDEDDIESNVDDDEPANTEIDLHDREPNEDPTTSEDDIDDDPEADLKFLFQSPEGAIKSQESMIISTKSSEITTKSSYSSTMQIDEKDDEDEDEEEEQDYQNMDIIMFIMDHVKSRGVTAEEALVLFSNCSKLAKKYI